MSDGKSGRLNLGSILKKRGAHFHFAGILGVSMSSLAELLHLRGYFVSGSDSGAGEMRERLSGIGIPISLGNKSEYMLGTDALIYSYAIGADSEEMRYAEMCGIPCFSRAELLGELMSSYSHRIGVSGTHGKSTTTAMIHKIFCDSGYLPTTFCGAPIDGVRAAVFGGDGYFIYEACEYRGAFLHFSPECAVITGIELDHTDCYSDLAAVTMAFEKSLLPATRVVLNSDYAAAASLIPRIFGRVLTYGAGEGAAYRYRVLKKHEGGTEFSVTARGEVLGFFLPVVGEHNVANATAAIAVSMEYGISYADICASLADFTGISRRLEYLFSVGERAVLYDYAHHPTEIKAAISTVKELWGACTVVFRPHTYTRTRDLWDELAGSLGLADFAVIADVFAAREEKIEGISAENLARAIGDSAAYVSMEKITDYVLESTHGVILLMGAGDLEHIKKSLNLRRDK